MQQRTALDICVPKVEIGAVDDDATRRWKGAPEMLDRLAEASVRHIVRPTEDLRLPIGARTVAISAREFAGWVDEAVEGVTPVNKRRDGLKGLVVRELMRRTDRDDIWERSPELRAAVAKAWPTQQPIRMVDKLLPGPSGKRRSWTVADQFLVDEANSMLNGTPFTFGHVIVDEAQDHSAVSLRVIGRRSPQGSMTVLGDLAQSTTPAGQQDWSSALGHIRAIAAEVAVLTIGYRVPGPILDAANRLLPYTNVSSEPSRSVRLEGTPPVVRLAEPGDLLEAVATEVAAVRHRHHNTGVVAPAALHEAIGNSLAAHDLRLVDHVHDLASRRCSGVHCRGGEGPRVRRRGRRQRPPDIRWFGAWRASAVRRDDTRRAGTAPRRRCAASRRTEPMRQRGLTRWVRRHDEVVPVHAARPVG